MRKQTHRHTHTPSSTRHERPFLSLDSLESSMNSVPECIPPIPHACIPLLAHRLVVRLALGFLVHTFILRFSFILPRLI